MPDMACYPRPFDLPAADEDRRIGLTVDGVCRDATVRVDAWLVRRRDDGIYPVREDITEVARILIIGP